MPIVCESVPMSRLSHQQRWVLGCLAAYALLAAIILLSPVSYSGLLRWMTEWVLAVTGLPPFGTGWVEFFANILLFLPLGLLLTLLFRHPWYGALLAVGLSVAAELVQILIPSRQPTLRDILANLIGAVIGALLAWLFVLRRRRPARGPAAAASDAAP